MAKAQNAAVQMDYMLVVRVHQHAIYKKRRSMGGHGGPTSKFFAVGLTNDAQATYLNRGIGGQHGSIKPVE